MQVKFKKKLNKILKAYLKKLLLQYIAFVNFKSTDTDWILTTKCVFSLIAIYFFQIKNTNNQQPTLLVQLRLLHEQDGRFGRIDQLVEVLVAAASHLHHPVQLHPHLLQQGQHLRPVEAHHEDVVVRPRFRLVVCGRKNFFENF